MKNLVGKFVKIKGRDEKDPNHEGRVVDQKGTTVFVTNLNMPFCGNMTHEPFDIEDVELK